MAGPLPKNAYKIEVLEDRPPRVSFEQPDEALEVHPIAEVLNRIRVGDDFGLTKAGIVFQFNDGDEQTLIVQDFTVGAGQVPDHRGAPGDAAAGEARRLADGQPDLLRASPRTTTLAGAKRTETELRYLDIRPFKREYKLAEIG